jgi:phosphoribosylpyrophosphate synthetase
MGILVNKKEIETFVFSGGECHVKITASEIGDNTDILANLYNANDIMYLLLAVDAIRRINPKTAITLTMPYTPTPDKIGSATKAKPSASRSWQRSSMVSSVTKSSS